MTERPASRRATEGAFVVQLLPEPASDGSAFYGRVERIASGESCRFRSAQELVAFIARTAGIAVADAGVSQSPSARRDSGKETTSRFTEILARIVARTWGRERPATSRRRIVPCH